ncbi:AMP-binding protein [Romeria aff. gracilis LEGE 07310]|uniref:AMP-binding protein n=1 Tax=Vasconcelosia minhoensis LEGE 07310 TaxID=915328 RepID=A0A8J7AF26_9CYAN|nr:AMP-binding protein [Romeria gracilis]MBE9078251.1 AMP-binding protein [Romeria aff. gracilis LEGE 07310]
MKNQRSTATLNHYSAGGWQSWTLVELRQAAEEIALGLHHYAAIQKGDRVGLLMASSVPFVMADIGCLLAQLVTVPMLPEQPLESREYMLKETAASVLFVSELKQVEPLLPKLPDLSALRLIVVPEVPKDLSKHRWDRLQWALPNTVEMVTLEALRQRAKWSAAAVQALRAALHPQDLATIVYTPHASGRLLGAMLTHENLAGSVISAFSTLPCLRQGPGEVALSFLPLHHIFARGFIYGSLSYGQTIYFSNPRLVMKHLRELKPTVFFTVPRLLEKVYEGWQVAPQRLKRPFRQLQQRALSWAWDLASRYPLAYTQSRRYRAELWLAQRTVFGPLRNLFGGRIKCFISGGAALPAEVMTLLSGAGLKLCQGYGLTEASSTLSFTRRQWSRAGTVGVPMPGVEMAIAADGEVMVKSPYVMQGYYRAPVETQRVLEPNGWLHTGDRGEFSADGLLTLTGYKKELFKLSIGEYIAPRPIELALRQSPLVQQALVVGPGRKFCGLLIFPNMTVLMTQAQLMGLSMPPESLLSQPQIVAQYQSLVDQVNASLPLWSTVKRFQLINAELTVENGRLRSPGQLNREALYLAFAAEIDRLYQLTPRKALPESARMPTVPEPPDWPLVSWWPKIRTRFPARLSN